MSHRLTFRLLVVWVVFLGLLYSTLSVIRHSHFESGGFDLGIYDQAVWQYSRFQVPYNTIKERFILGDHLTLTLPLLAPLFWFWEDARMLLIFQAFWLASSSIAIFLLGRLRKFSPFVSFAVSFVYSLFYGIQYAVFFDFHPVIIGVGLLPWVGYLLETKRIRLLWIAVALLLLTQENMGVALAGLGLIYVFQRQYRSTALLFIFAGFLSSFVAMKIVGYFSPIGFEYAPVLPKSIVDFITQLFNSSEKRQVWLYSFAWFSFLPLLSPGAVLAVILDLSQYFVTGPALVRMWSPYMHHRAILAPLFTLGALEGLRRVRSIIQKINLSKNAIARINKFILPSLSIVLLLSAGVQQYGFHYPLNKLVKREFWKAEVWMRDNEELLKLVPADAPVAAQQNLVPHLSHRKEIYLAWPRYHDEKGWQLDFAGKPEYLIVDTRSNQWLTQILETNEHFQEAIENMEKAGDIQLLQQVGMARIYRIRYN